MSILFLSGVHHSSQIPEIKYVGKFQPDIFLKKNLAGIYIDLSSHNFLALLDCVSRANAVARASVVRPSVRKTRFLRNRQAN